MSQPFSDGQAPAPAGYHPPQPPVPAQYGQSVAMAQPMPQVVVQRSFKETGIAYLWWLLFGFLGAHHFYLGKIGRAIAYLLTGGFLGIGLLVDLFTLPRQTRQINAEIAAGTR